MDFKRCRDCGEEKSLDAFYGQLSGKDGHQAYCKHCHNHRNNANRRERAKHPPAPRESLPSGMKRCRDCREIKALDAFNRVNGHLTASYCKPCHHARNMANQRKRMANRVDKVEFTPSAAATSRFWRSVDRRADDECWYWKGRRETWCIGEFNDQDHQFTVRQYSFLLAFGGLPANATMKDSCGNPECINPAHLQARMRDNMVGPDRRICSRCKQTKNLSDFRVGSTPSGRSRYCKTCSKSVWREIRYGLLPGEYDEMLKNQKGLCGICGRPPGKKSLAIDHDHATGKVRLLLCDPCNVGLGMFGHSEERLTAAILYLKKFGDRAILPLPDVG